MTLTMKLLLVLFIAILAALLILVIYLVVSSHSGKKQPERKWTDPKFHD